MNKKRFLTLFSITGVMALLASCGNASSSSSSLAPSSSSEGTASSVEPSSKDDSSSSTSEGSEPVEEEIVKIVEEEDIREKPKTGYLEEEGNYFVDYKTLDEAHEAGRDLAVNIAEEGMVLMKNANNALPLTRDERSVTLLGVKSVDIQTGGGGSGNGYVGDSSKTGKNDYKIDPCSLEESMKAAGFRVNERVLDLYRDNIAAMSYEEYSPSSTSTQTLTRELPLSYYNNMVTKTYGSYNDAAIITFSRSGAEGLDEIATKDHHVLQLTDDEIALVKHAKANFQKVIVLINSGNVMELGALAEEKTDDNLGVDAILYVGHVGNDGAKAIGEILSGEVNPSGKLVDTWIKDFSKDPTYTNFGANDQNGDEYDNFFYDEAGQKTSYHSLEYREDIYMGYRYYETRHADMESNAKGTGDAWYASEVAYPFGHGLSYTQFDWKLVAAGQGEILSPKSTITVAVEVTNVGAREGKEVVEVYAHQPYVSGSIEKAEKVLAAYGKTKLLQPGESQVITLRFTAQEIASFDWDDRDNDGFVGYELEAGDYDILVSKDAHTPVAKVTRTVKETIHCETDLDTGNPIKPVFSALDGDLAKYNTTNESLLNHLLSREDGLHQPSPATKADRTVSQGWLDMMEEYATYTLSEDADNALWSVNEVPASWRQASSHEEGYADVTKKIGAISGVDFQLLKNKDGKVIVGTDEGSKAWDEFLNQLTWEELCQLVSQGDYGRPSVASIGLPFQLDIDGPSQLAWYGYQQAIRKYGDLSPEEKAMIEKTADGMGTFWPGAVLIASTWNTKLAEKHGRVVGNESMLTNTVGWYGPACNTHRSGLGGRNFEYYSEDPLIAGKTVAAVTRGAASKGCISYVKHMFLNDQETDRGGICTYATEQAIREIYLRPYEYALKEGRSLGTMGAGNRIGNVRVYDSYALYNGIIRDEWESKALHITDSVANGSHPDMDEMLRAGINCPLGSGLPRPGREAPLQNDTSVGEYDAASNMVKVDGAPSPTQWYVVRNAAMHVLYASANSNGIDNGVAKVDVTRTLKGGSVDTAIITPEDFGCLTFANVTEVIPDGETSKLPEGTTLSTSGVLSGHISAPGTYVVTLNFLADGWIPMENIVVRIIVEDGIAYSGATSIASGAVSGNFTQNVYELGASLTGTAIVDLSPFGMPYSMPVDGLTGTISKIAFASKDLPEGLTLSEDGVLSGNLEAGTYTFSVSVVATANTLYYGYCPSVITVSFTQTFTFAVAA